MYILTVASLKGGSGKTTISAAVAVELERLGYGPVAVIDTDPQGSLRDWAAARQADTPMCVWVETTQLSSYLAELRQAGMQCVVIDTPPAFGSMISDAVALADLVLIPVRPSPNDLRAVHASIDAITIAGKDFMFVINAATPRTMIVPRAIKALLSEGRIVPTVLHNRVNFPVSMLEGRTVNESHRHSRSAAEVTKLTQYLYKRLRFHTSQLDERRSA